MPMLRSARRHQHAALGRGDDVPADRDAPAVGCSRPATQRRVVVLPQPDGPSRTTISPAGDVEAHVVDGRRAGREHLAQLARRSVPPTCASPPTTSTADSRRSCSTPRARPSRSFSNSLEVRHPHLDRPSGSKPWRVGGGVFSEVRLPSSLIMKAWPSSDRPSSGTAWRHSGSWRSWGCRRRRGLIGTPSGGKNDLHRRAVVLLGVDDVVEQRRDRDLAAHQRVGERRAGGVERDARWRPASSSSRRPAPGART